MDRSSTRRKLSVLAAECRCVVPFTSFSENEALADGSHPPVRFARSDDRPLAFFAGIYIENWTSVRKAKTGVETADVYAFLTTEPNAAEVRPVHPKAMPVILATAPKRSRPGSRPRLVRR
jgi:putative SOS response-associated peptidase YedK